MKIFAFFLYIPFLLGFSPDKTTTDDLKSLYDNKRYFDLRDALGKHQDTSSNDILFYKAMVSNKFNQIDSSIKYIQSYLSLDFNLSKPELRTECYETLADNYIKIFEYRKAAEAYEVLLNNYTSRLDSEEISDIRNSAKLWNSFSQVPRQSIKFLSDSFIKTTKDKAGLTNIPVEVNGIQHNFIFDTGANLSTISESFAAELGFKIIDSPIMVNSITGKQVSAKLAVAPPLRVGNTVISNSVFLVFQDDYLSFPQMNYKINGIIGFPVIQALGQITITRDDAFIVPMRATVSGEQNMFMEDLTPVVAALYRNKRLAFSFDTGAKSSLLNYSFYKDFENEIKQNASSHLQKIGGAGGLKEVTAYEYRDFNINIAGKNIELDEITVITEPLDNNNKYFFGNLGQDIVKQFDRTTLNFKTMSIRFD